MTPSNLLVFCVTSLALALAPGPDILYVLARSLAQGRRAGLVATLGFVSGLPAHTTLAALGLAAVIRSSPGAWQVVQYLGAAYLVYLAVGAARSARAFLPSDRLEPRALRAIYFQSLTMNLLNPKVIAFFVAFLPGFVRPSAVPAAVQMVVLGLLFSICALVVFSVVACGAGTLGNLLTRRPRVATGLRWGTVVVLMLLAVNLLFLGFRQG